MRRKMRYPRLIWISIAMKNEGNILLLCRVQESAIRICKSLIDVALEVHCVVAVRLKCDIYVGIWDFS